MFRSLQPILEMTMKQQTQHALSANETCLCIFLVDCEICKSPTLASASWSWEAEQEGQPASAEVLELKASELL